MKTQMRSILPEDRRSWTPNPCAMDTALQRLRVSGDPKPFEIRRIIGLPESGAVNKPENIG